MQKTKKIITVIGAGKELYGQEAYDFAQQLGKHLVEEGYIIATGGLGGIMEAVMKGARQSPKWFAGATIGIIPQEDKFYANPYCDVVIPSGMGVARNALLVNMADAIVAIGGGPGTLSELAFAWQKGKKTCCVTNFGGWATEIFNKELDTRASGLFSKATSVEEVLLQVQQIVQQ